MSESDEVDNVPDMSADLVAFFTYEEDLRSGGARPHDYDEDPEPVTQRVYYLDVHTGLIVNP